MAGSLDPQTLLKELSSAIEEHNPSNFYDFIIEFVKEVRKRQEAPGNLNFSDVRALVAERFPSLSGLDVGTAPSVAPPSTEPYLTSPMATAKQDDLGVTYNFSRRYSVSAESLTPQSIEQTEKTFFPKTKEAQMRIAAAIANNLLFRNLAADQRKDVVDAMFEVKVEPGKSIIIQGDDGDNFYVVDEGNFDIFVNGKKVVEVGPGGSFGELALMYNCPRAATVTATTDAVLWAVDRVTFQATVMNNTFQKRKLYESFVKTVPILNGLNNEELVKVVDALEPVSFEDGENIVEQGEDGDCFYLIVNGECVCTKLLDESEEPVEVMRLKSGDYFGELALLTDQPRAATVTAIGDVQCVVLDVKAFIRLLGPCVDLLKRNAEHYKHMKALLQEQGLALSSVTN